MPQVQVRTCSELAAKAGAHVGVNRCGAASLHPSLSPQPKESKTIRALFLCIGMLLASGQASATTYDLETIVITGMRVDRTILCEGSGCSGLSLFPMPQPILDVIDISDLSPDLAEGPQAQCDGDSLIREVAAWKAYQALMAIRYPNYGDRVAADSQNIGQIISIQFSNGSVGRYQRADSTYGTTHGVWEVSAPNCNG